MDWAPAFHVLAHELRAPTAVIGGYARMLREGRLGDADREQALRQVEQAAGRLALFGRQASDLSRWLGTPSAGRSPLSAGALIDRAMAACTMPADRIVRALDPGAEGFVIGCLDETALAAAVASAIDASGRESGDAGVRVAGRSADAGVDLLIGVAGAEVWRGNLPGPESGDPPDLDRGGMGLAFVLAAAVVSAHGGRMWTVGGRRGVVGVRLPTFR